MKPKPTVSIIICTYNRYESLRDTLKSLLRLSVASKVAHEIIVVDNNSTDQTRQVSESFLPEFEGRLRYLFEGHQGKSYALNLGIQHADGNIIAFTDDDVLVREDYLESIDQAMRDHGEDAGFMGGKILPKWLGEKPQWISGPLLGALAMLDYGNKSIILHSGLDPVYLRKHLLFGANVIFRKEIFAKYGGFDTQRVVAEDTEMCLRLYANGVKAVYTPNVVVYHKVPVSRTKPGYFYRWYFQQGKHRELVEEVKPKFFYPFGIPLWFLKRTLVLLIRSLIDKEPHQRISHRCQTLFNCGQMIRMAKGIT